MKKILGLLAALVLLPFTNAQAMDLMSQDNGVVWSNSMGPEVQDVALNIMHNELNTRFVRIIMPRGYYNATDFNADCAKLDVAVDKIRANGMEPFISLTYKYQGSRGIPPGRYSASTRWWYDDFGGWCAAIARRYQGRVNHYAIWNEPNVGTGPSMPATTYHDVYDVGYNAIKGAVGCYVFYGELGAMAGTTVGGMAPIEYFRQSLLATTSWRPTAAIVRADGFCWHPYQHNNHPNDKVAAENSGYGIGRIYEWVLRRNWTYDYGTFRTPAGGRVPMLLTEYGYANPAHCMNQVSCPPPSEGTRASWIQAAWDIAAGAGVTHFCYYHLINTNLDSWDTGIVERGGNWLRTQTFWNLRARTNGAPYSLEGPDASWRDIDGSLHLVVRGSDMQPYHKWWNPAGGWSSFVGLGGRGLSGPSITTKRGDSRLDIFLLGEDNAIWHKWATDVWQPWYSLGPWLTSGPDAVWRDDGTLLMVANNPQLFINWNAGGGWSGYGGLGGSWLYAPTVASGGSHRGPSAQDIFVVGTDSMLYHKVSSPTAWDPNWYNLGGPVASAPDAKWRDNGVLDIMVRGTDGRLYHKYWGPTTGWSGFGGVGVWCQGKPSIASTGTAGRIDVFTRGTDNMIYHKYAAPGWVAGQTSMGGPVY